MTDDEEPVDAARERYEWRLTLYGGVLVYLALLAVLAYSFAPERWGLAVAALVLESGLLAAALWRGPSAS